MSINEELEQGLKENGISSGRNYYKFQKGDNRIRILTKGAVIATHFFGKGQPASTCYGIEKGCPFHGEGAPRGKDGKEQKPSVKYTCYILDVKNVTNLDENAIEIADLPYSVIKQVGDYQNNIDYAFTEMPMPYDVTVKYDPDSPSPANMYKVIASPKRVEVSESVKARLAEEMSKYSPDTSVQKKKDFQIKKHDEQGIRKQLKTREELNAEYKEKFDNIKNEPDETVPDISPDDIPF